MSLFLKTQHKRDHCFWKFETNNFFERVKLVCLFFKSTWTLSFFSLFHFCSYAQNSFWVADQSKMYLRWHVIFVGFFLFVQCIKQLGKNPVAWLFWCKGNGVTSRNKLMICCGVMNRVMGLDSWDLLTHDQKFKKGSLISSNWMLFTSFPFHCC